MKKRMVRFKKKLNKTKKRGKKNQKEIRKIRKRHPKMISINDFRQWASNPSSIFEITWNE